MTRTVRAVFAAAAAVCLLAALAVPALALGEVDVTAVGTVTLAVQDEQYRADLTENQAAAAVEVYRVADVNEYGVYTPVDAFASLADNASWNGGLLGADTDVGALAEAAVDVIGPEDGRTAEPTVTQELAVGAENGAALEPLPAGLYLVAPQKVETRLWVYTFSPMLLSVPAVGTQADAANGRVGAPDLSEDGRSWQYAYTVFMKPERKMRLSEIVIEKTLANYNATLGQTTFLFDVEATRDGQVVYSNVVGLTFNGAGTQSVTVSGIPTGSDVTVTEAYSGGSYAVVGGQARVQIQDLSPAADGNASRAAFTNDYDDSIVPDRSVTNTFQFDGTGWKWRSNEEAG